MEGVLEAEFAYPEGRGTITYDPTLTSDSAVIAELRRATGFAATVRTQQPEEELPESNP